MIMILAILCDLFGTVKWPFQMISDLQLEDKKVTLNHLDDDDDDDDDPKYAGSFDH